jgi:hypothetical protein
MTPSEHFLTIMAEEVNNSLDLDRDVYEKETEIFKRIVNPNISKVRTWEVEHKFSTKNDQI